MNTEYDLTMVFVEPKEHKRVLSAASHIGFHGATVLYARGTVSNKILAAFGMDSLRKEILLLIGARHLSDELHLQLYDALDLKKRGHGIMATLPLSRVMGLHEMSEACWKGERGMQYELITVVVDNGQADNVIEAATNAGAMGATVLHGRGSGAHQVEKFFNLEIEPEKELVLFVVESKMSEKIIYAIRSIIDFDAPNSGILFSLDISQVSGLLRG